MLSKLSRTGPLLRLDLGEEDPKLFSKLLDLALGDKVQLDGDNSMEDLLDLGGIADRFLIEPIRAEVEREAIKIIDSTTCARVLARTRGTGMLLLSAAARDHALQSFGEVAAAPSFVDLPADELLQLLQDDSLVAHGEDVVLDAVIRWAAAGPRNEAQAGPLLGAVRHHFVPRMSAARAMEAATPVVRQLVSDAMAAVGAKHLVSEAAGGSGSAGVAGGGPCASVSDVEGVLGPDYEMPEEAGKRGRGKRAHGDRRVTRSESARLKLQEAQQNSGEPSVVDLGPPPTPQPDDSAMTRWRVRSMHWQYRAFYSSLYCFNSDEEQRLDAGEMVYALEACGGELFVSEERGPIQVLLS